MEETIQSLHRVLSFAGISIYAIQNWDSKLWFLLQIFTCFIGFTTMFFTSAFVIVHLSDLLLCIQGACILTTGMIMFISLVICLVFRNRFRAFLLEMCFKDKMFEMELIRYVFKVEHGRKLKELRDMVVNSQEKLLYVTRTLLKTYVASVWLCATLYLCGPIYRMLITGDGSQRLLAFDMWFPWSLENLYVYIFSFIYHAYAGYICCIGQGNPALCAIFSLSWSSIVLLVGQIIRQLSILTFILSNLNKIAKETAQGSPERKEAYCSEILIQCVKHYLKLKRFSNSLNVICQPFYLALILVATMLVCVCSVKIAISDKLSLDTMKYYVHIICFIIMVLMFCWLGQQVENECEKLEEAVTEKWYTYDRTHKGYVKIFKMAASQRMPIYIFGTITLSLPTFTWFIRNGMSFFTLVMSVLED